MSEIYLAAFFTKFYNETRLSREVLPYENCWKYVLLAVIVALFAVSSYSIIRKREVDL